MGITTHFPAKTARARGARVYTSEINGDFHSIASSIVGGMENVHLYHGDSVDFLQSLTATASQAINFVYLDAHLGAEILPLREELAILRDWPNTIIMIDDFKVPFDGAFNWDKYSDEREISLTYIKDSIGSASVYFPSYKAQEEHVAMPRGYCVISMSDRYNKVLDRIQLLRRAK